MKPILPFLLLLASGYSFPAIPPEPLRAECIRQQVVLDGRLNESFYQTLRPLDGFSQFHPQNGAKASQSTRTYVYYDRKNIYFAFHCFDEEPAKITADITPFNEFMDNDEVGVLLDCFHDKRSYDYFAVNPRGIKKGKKTIWDAAARVDETGWSAEIRIPFKSLRFPVQPVQHWALNFKRVIYRLNETDYWMPVRRDQRGVIGDTFADLAGVQDIHGGKNIEVFPYAGLRNTRSGGETESKLAFGLDAKFGVTSNLTLDLTTSPDYSDVESDPFFYQLNPFEYSLQDNRPFYQEGSDYFQTAIKLFYSRRITSPTLAIKLTGKEKGYSMGLLAADNQGPVHDQFFAVVRLKKDLFRLSNVGVTYSALEEKGNWNRNVGLDFTLRFGNIYRFTGMTAFAFNRDQAGKAKGLYQFQFSRSVDRGLTVLARYNRVDPGTVLQAGYIAEADFQRLLLILKYSWRWENSWLETMKWLLWKTSSFAIRSPMNTVDSYELSISLATRRRLNLTVSCPLGRERPQILDRDGELAWEQRKLPVSGWSVNLTSADSTTIQGGLAIGRFNSYVYNDDFSRAFPGWTFGVAINGNIKFSPQLQWGVDFSRTRIRSTDGAIDFRGDLLATSLSYQAGRNLATYAKFQYDSHFDRFQYDFLIGYEPANVSKLYLSIKNYSEGVFRLFNPAARSIAFKISYLFRL